MGTEMRRCVPSAARSISSMCLVMCLALLSACQPAVVRPSAAMADEIAFDGLAPLSSSAGVGGGAVRTDLSSASIQLTDYVPVRRYEDVFTTDGANRKVIVEYGWDYRSGVAVEPVRDAAGTVLSRTEKPGYTLNFTDRELELAIAIAREDPRLHNVLAADDLNFYAGFPYREAKEIACSDKSRCVHVIVSAGDGQRHVAHAIVDLMSRSVVHPFLDPDRKPDPIPSKS